MAGWLKIAARSFVVAAGAGAAQLGVAQALALLVWSSVPTPEVWRRQLTWLLFMFAGSVLVGVAGGRRSVRAVRQAIANRRADAAAARHSGLVPHQRGMRAARRRAIDSARHKTLDTARGIAAGASRVGATLFAALGAWASFALVWLPTRDTYAAADLRVLALAAIIGIGVGSVISLLSLVAAPIAANAAVTVAGVWIFALASVAVALVTGHETGTPRLAVLDAPDLIGPDEWWFGPNLMIVVAALFGFAVAATARWVGAPRLAIALSGLAGPAIVAAGYLLVGPAPELMSSYVASLVAATVGLLTSAATAATQRREAKPKPAPAALTQGAAGVPPPPRAIEAGGPPTAASRPAPAAAGGAYPTANPASQYPAAAGQSPYPPRQPAGPAPAAVRAYSANPYPTNQYPTMAGWSEAARTTPPSTVENPVYHAPARSAPVPPPPVTPPAPRAQPVPRPVAKPAPAPKPAPTKTPLPEPFAAPPGRAPAARPTATPPPAPPASAPLVFPPAPYAAPAATAPTPAPTPASAAPPSSPAATRAPASPPAPPPAATSKAAGKGRAKAKATPPPVPATPAAAQAKPDGVSTMPVPPPPTRKSKARGRADQTVRVYEPVKAEPVRKQKGDLPRTSRPAEVVAVEATRPSADAEPGAIRGRRARRRAAKLARERAEWEARQAKQREEDARTMGKREREHVDWVQRLVSLPDDPSLTTRQK